MFVNRINNIPKISGVGFKSLDHKTNSAGREIEVINYPYDHETETCEFHYMRAIVNDKYNIIPDESSKKVVTLKPEGVEVDVADLLNLDKNEG